MDGDLAREVAASSFGMVPFCGWSEPIVNRVLQAAQERHRRAVSRALIAAETISGLTRDEIGERVADDPALVPLLTRILYTAGMNGFDDVLIAMGAALGEALTDPIKVDGAEVVMQAMQGLGRHHIAVLRTVVSDKPVEVVDGEEHVVLWRAVQVEDATHFTPDLTELCLAGLVNAGLVHTNLLWGGQFGYEPTETGITVLAVLEARANADSRPSRR